MTYQSNELLDDFHASRIEPQNHNNILNLRYILVSTWILGYGTQAQNLLFCSLVKTESGGSKMQYPQ